MRSLPFSKFRRFLIILTLLILSGGFGYRLGEAKVNLERVDNRIVINRDTPGNNPIDFSLFWDVWSRIHRYHIDARDIDNQKLVWGAIAGMVNALGDPYTVFLTPSENQDFKDDLGGAFEGIGAQLSSKDGRILVVAPITGSPASTAGIKAGDWILKVGDEDVINWSVTQAVAKIRGPKGTQVVLSVLHENAESPVNISIIRDTIKVPSVEYWIKTPSEIIQLSGSYKGTAQIAYLHLTRFGDRLSEEWSSAIGEIRSAYDNGHIAGMILDLRNNPGGYLDGSVYLTSEFLTDGNVVSQINSDGTRADYKVNRDGLMTEIPLVVLINKGSASASEIVAGALKDHRRAKIVGEKSFGKGSVQSPQDLRDGAGLHITTGKWLTPDGDWITKIGIVPDFEIELESLEATKDAQLEKAVQLLLQ
ncbi:hypothetical protein A2154_02560 [Candidatus Gottesmanbacteria bacterium RBG_16_43_7]|uniref:PDZ domain-containing protein n=1 Tax=Candidatus Gottesmanbacteria bacterium RBG_16_43_7 TaxID=1798373 RepID=A0A1F5ZCU3_9BACT|nr:MAG: hypothetical protein A2154_02560 [Candidatus Gottesmanbacteria bacterium RBG_16_43_7]